MRVMLFDSSPMNQKMVVAPFSFALRFSLSEFQKNTLWEESETPKTKFKSDGLQCPRVDIFQKSIQYQEIKCP